MAMISSAHVFPVLLQLFAAAFKADALTHIWSASKEVADNNMAVTHKIVTPILLLGFSAASVRTFAPRMKRQASNTESQTNGESERSCLMLRCRQLNHSNLNR